MPAIVISSSGNGGGVWTLTVTAVAAITVIVANAFSPNDTYFLPCSCSIGL